MTTNRELWNRIPPEIQELAEIDRCWLYPYVWFWKKWRGDRKGHRCRVLARGKRGGPHNVLVEFEDGERVVAPRFAIRKARQDGV